MVQTSDGNNRINVLIKLIVHTYFNIYQNQINEINQ